MKVVNDWPPNIEIIRKTLPNAPLANAVFAYGNILYNPGRNFISEDLMVHEETHETQQFEFGGPEKWWDKYLYDRSFRLSQEVEAYANQYVYIRGIYSRQVARKFLVKIAKDLSGPLYDHIVGFDLAKEAIFYAAGSN